MKMARSDKLGWEKRGPKAKFVGEVFFETLNGARFEFELF